jgi:hypothetical protein
VTEHWRGSRPRLEPPAAPEAGREDGQPGSEEPTREIAASVRAPFGLTHIGRVLFRWLALPDVALERPRSLQRDFHLPGLGSLLVAGLSTLTPGSFRSAKLRAASGVTPSALQMSS